MRGLRFVLLSIGALSVFSVYMIMTTTDPSQATMSLKSALYGSMFIAVVSGLALLRISIHPLVRKTALEPVPLLPIFRVSVLISSVLIVFLLLLSLRDFSSLDAALIIISAMLFEMFFRVRIPIRTYESSKKP